MCERCMCVRRGSSRSRAGRRGRASRSSRSCGGPSRRPLRRGEAEEQLRAGGISSAPRTPRRDRDPTRKRLPRPPPTNPRRRLVSARRRGRERRPSASSRCARRSLRRRIATSLRSSTVSCGSLGNAPGARGAPRAGRAGRTGGGGGPRGDVALEIRQSPGDGDAEPGGRGLVLLLEAREARVEVALRLARSVSLRVAVTTRRRRAVRSLRRCRPPPASWSRTCCPVVAGRRRTGRSFGVDGPESWSTEPEDAGGAEGGRAGAYDELATRQLHLRPSLRATRTRPSNSFCKFFTTCVYVYAWITCSLTGCRATRCGATWSSTCHWLRRGSPCMPLRGCSRRERTVRIGEQLTCRGRRGSLRSQLSCTSAPSCDRDSGGIDVDIAAAHVAVREEADEEAVALVDR